jgi:hypothetical protein
VNRREISNRCKDNPDGNNEHAAEANRQIAAQKLNFRPDGSDLRLEFHPQRRDFVAVASLAPDIALAMASAVSPCFGGKPAFSSRRASFNVSKGTPLMNRTYGARPPMSSLPSRKRLSGQITQALIEDAILHDVSQVLALAVEQ